MEKALNYLNLILPLLLIGMTACTSALKKDYRFIEIPEIINSNQSLKLSPYEVQYDLSQTIYSLDTAYSGRHFLPADEFDRLKKNLKSIRGTYSAIELCKQIDEVMDSVSDNHLNAKFNGTPCFESPNNRDGSVGKNFYSKTNDIPWKVQLKQRNNKTALMISITGFPKAKNPVWNHFIESVELNLPKSDLVILDMRGNGGGDDTKGYALATLLAGAELKEPYDKQWSNPSPEAQQIFLNSIENWARDYKKNNKEVPAYLLELQRDFIAKREQAINGELSLKEQTDNDSTKSDFVFEKSIQKPIYILIDADCASSCESTTDFFEFNPLVKTVGENSAGFVHFGNNGSVFLKNSGIQLQMATSYTSYLDGRFIEKTGIKPMIEVPKGENALDYAWQDFLTKRIKK
jgi:hypothetical protein